MLQPLQITRQTRTNFVNLIKGLSLESINKVPDSFNNNIAWNFGHVIVTQQLLCCKLAGQEMNISNEYVEKYRKGSKPTSAITQSELDFLISKSTSLIDEFEADWNSGKFVAFAKYMTSYGIELNSVEDAIAFNNAHEGLHFGYAMALRHLVV